MGSPQAWLSHQAKWGGCLVGRHEMVAKSRPCLICYCRFAAVEGERCHLVRNSKHCHRLGVDVSVICCCVRGSQNPWVLACDHSGESFPLVSRPCFSCVRRPFLCGLHISCCFFVPLVLSHCQLYYCAAWGEMCPVLFQQNVDGQCAEMDTDFEHIFSFWQMSCRGRPPFTLPAVLSRCSANVFGPVV